MTPSAPAPLFQLKITLRGAKPPIWRRVAVPANMTLFHLHRVIQIVMPWTDTHLHQFYFGKKFYQLQDEELEPNPDSLDERVFTVKQVIPRVDSKLVYEYDFGDSWVHDIVVEKILPPDPSMKHPMCLAGARHAPPEDCGGIPGFSRMLRLVEDPSNADPFDKEWLAGDAKHSEYELGWRNANLRKYVK